MIQVLGILASVILAAAGALHVYWAAGGRLGVSAVLPEATPGGRAFVPSPLVTGLVAAALFAAALVLLGRLGLWGSPLPGWTFHWGSWGLAAVLFLRAVGDFRYFGFLKKAADTRFARWDSLLFSPLCVFLAFAAALVALG